MSVGPDVNKSREDDTNTVQILLLSALFPHAGEPTLGVFVRNRLEHLIADEDVKATVIAPVPWFPFKCRIFGAYGRAAQADRKTTWKNIEIYHPRYLVIPKVGMLLTPKFMAWSIKRLLRRLLAQGKEFDLIDAHYLYPDSVAAAEVAKAFQKPVVMTARGSDVTQIALLEAPRRMILAACNAASHIVTVSKSLKVKLERMGVASDKITSIRNGINLEKFSLQTKESNQLRRNYSIEKGKPVLLFAGWLIPRKRVDLVIDALALLPEFHGVIVGDGPLRQKLEQQARALNIQDRVIFAGQKAPTEMPAYFSMADVFCLPSEREGWANVMLEALACGTPVVSRAVDGALELFDGVPYGRLVEGDSPQSYADAISELLEANTAREEIRSFASEYGWEATSAAQMTIFRQILAKQNL